MKINRKYSNELKTAPLFINWNVRGGLYINDEKFCKEILLQATSFKAITYTCDARMLGNCSHLIYNVLKNGPVPKHCKARKIGNVHTKMYIVDDNHIYMGSMNLVLPGRIHNVMVQLSPENTKSALLYWKNLWNLCK